MSKRSKRKNSKQSKRVPVQRKNPGQSNPSSAQPEHSEHSKQKKILPKQSGKKEHKLTKKKVWIAISSVVALLASIATIADFILPRKETTVNNYYADKPIELSYSNSRYCAGQEFFNNGEFEKALKMFEEAKEEHEQHSNADVNLARIQYAEGMTYKYKGDYENAVTNYTIAIGTLNSIEKKSDDIKYELGYVYYLRGMAYIDDHQLEKGRLDLNQCSDAVGYFHSGADAEQWYGEASVYNAYGRLYFASAYSECSSFDTGEILGYTYQDAYDAFNTALKFKGLHKYVDGDTDGEILTYYGDQVKIFEQLEVYSSSAQNSEGDEYFWNTLSVIDVEAADILLNRASVVLCMGYYDAALCDCDAVLKIYDQIGPSVRSKVAYAYFTISQIMMEQSVSEGGELSEKAAKQFIEYMDEGVKYNKKWLGEGVDTAILYENLGGAYLFAEQWDEAIEAYEEAKGIFEDLGLQEDVEKQERFIEAANEGKRLGGEGRWLRG